MVDALLEAFANAGLPITTDQAYIMARYYALLEHANQNMNLTAIQSEREAATLHFADSAAPLRFNLLQSGALCCDVGSGAGFPGLVLAILRPDCRFILLDSLAKRIRFLSDMTQELDLKNVMSAQMRAEDAGHTPQYRERFAIVLSRAVAPLPVLLEYCLPLVKVGGQMIAYKGPSAQEELVGAKHALETLGAGKTDLMDSGIPDRSHHLLVVEKVHPTPRTYPRKAGTPSKQPL